MWLCVLFPLLIMLFMIALSYYMVFSFCNERRKRNRNNELYSFPNIDSECLTSIGQTSSETKFIWKMRSLFAILFYVSIVVTILLILFGFILRKSTNFKKY